MVLWSLIEFHISVHSRCNRGIPSQQPCRITLMHWCTSSIGATEIKSRAHSKADIQEHCPDRSSSEPAYTWAGVYVGLYSRRCAGRRAGPSSIRLAGRDAGAWAGEEVQFGRTLAQRLKRDPLLLQGDTETKAYLAGHRLFRGGCSYCGNRKMGWKRSAKQKNST